MASFIETTRRGAVLANAHRLRRGLAIATVGVAYSMLTLATQAALIAAGYDVGPEGADGKLGKNTIAAIKKYQKDHGLPITGKIDEALTRSLGSGVAGAAGAAASASSAVAEASRTATYVGVGVGVVVVVIAVVLAVAKFAKKAV